MIIHYLQNVQSYTKLIDQSSEQCINENNTETEVHETEKQKLNLIY